MASREKMREEALRASLDTLIMELKSLPGPELWQKMHSLAAEEYLPAIDFFLDALTDPDPKIRIYAIECLGFHYVFAADSLVMQRLRSLLQYDPDENVRLSAAGALGSQLRHSRLGPAVWPDPSLAVALKLDADEHVRRAAFSALLDQARLPPDQVMLVYNKLTTGELHPTFAEAERIIAGATTGSS